MKIQNEEAVSPGKAVTTEDAVSPVIGVILMVAITVILAAVIAAFVFGLAGTTGTTKNVAVTGSQTNATAITLTYQGGQDADQVETLTTNVWDADGTQIVTNDARSNPSVGLSWGVTGTTGRDHVVVTATFFDGTEQVVLDSFI